MSISSLSSSTYQRPSLAEMHAKMFTQADTDGNGSISKDELKTMMANAPTAPDGSDSTTSVDDLFAKIDTDGDGKISEAENDAYLDTKDQERAALFGDMPPPPPSDGTSGEDTSVKALENLLKALKEGTSSDSSSSVADTTTSVQTTDIQAAAEKLIDAMLEQLRQRDGQYSSTGSTTAANTSSTLFSAQA